MAVVLLVLLCSIGDGVVVTAGCGCCYGSVTCFFHFSCCGTRVGGGTPLFCVCVFFKYFLDCCSLDVNTASFTLQAVAPADAQAVRISE